MTGREYGWGLTRMDKRKDLQVELQRLLGDRGITRFLDAVLPLTGYFILEYFTDVGTALIAALIGAVLVGVVRLYKRESLVYILTGIGGVLVWIFIFLALQVGQ